MNKTKLVFFICLMARLLLYVSFADALPPTGHDAVFINISFDIQHPNTFNEDVKVVFTDISTNNKYTYTLKAVDRYSEGIKYNVLGNTTYEISLEYNMSKFQILNKNDTQVTVFPVAEKDTVLSWKVVGESPHGEQSVGANVKNTKEEPSEILNEFIESTQFIVEDSNFHFFLKNWSNEVFKNQYISIRNNTLESWMEMTLYQQAIYSLLYTYPVTLLSSGNEVMPIKNKADFLNKLHFAKSELSKIENGEVVYLAIVKVWEYHWTTWQDAGEVIYLFDYYDFKANTNTDLQEVNQKKYVDMDDYISKKTLNSLKGNLLSFGIMFVLSVILLIRHMKSRYNN